MLDNLRSDRRIRGVIAAIVLLGIIGSASNFVLAASNPGAIFTTDSTCTGTNLNIFASQDDVYSQFLPNF